MRTRVRSTLIAVALAMMILAGTVHAAEPGPAPADRQVLGLFDISWRDVREFLLIVIAVVAAVGPTLWFTITARLAGLFAAKRDVDEIAARLGVVETGLHRLPSEDDFKDLSKRVGQLEGAISVANANLEGLKDLLNRIDFSVKLLVKHHINGGDDA